VPGDGSGTFSQHGRRWHHAFHRTADLPEALVAGREDIYLGWFYRNYGYQPGAISPADMEEYLRTYRQPGALRAGFSYYRAINEDVAHNEALLKRNGKLRMPVLALGGGKGFGRGIETLESLQRVSNDVRGGVIEDCGHWIQEEKPDEVVKQVLAFLDTE
jgi:pimeloyl-ACP methyl ester carboxylesterase